MVQAFRHWMHCRTSAVGLLALVAGCGTPVSYNVPAPRFAGSAVESNRKPAAPGPDLRQPGMGGRPFIGIAISGGGSRAANFGWSVLGELQANGLLAEVDSLSSVSGGSIAAALYVLNARELRTRADFARYDESLRYDFLQDWTLRLLSPVNWFRILSGNATRTDVMAEVFDDILFKRRSYAALPQDNGDWNHPLFPQLYINATSTARPYAVKPFVFEADTFYNSLGSDLGEFPISRAVMASGAFPGVFGHITLNNYRAVNPESLVTGSDKTAYEHLYDGGPADNLGVTTLVQRARNVYLDSLRRENPMNGCLFIIVDSHVRNYGAEAKAYKTSPDTHWYDSIVKPTAWESIDVLLNANRLRTLRALNLSATADDEPDFGAESRTVYNWFRPPPEVDFIGRAVAEVAKSPEAIEGFKLSMNRANKALKKRSVAESNESITEELIAEILKTGGLPLRPMSSREYIPVSDFPLFSSVIPWADSVDGDSLNELALQEMRKAGEVPDAGSWVDGERLQAVLKKARANAPACKVWHITLDRLRSMTDYVLEAGKTLEQDAVDQARLKSARVGALRFDESKYMQEAGLSDTQWRQMIEVSTLRYMAWGVASRTATNYHLETDTGCTPGDVQKTLSAAAGILVSEDRRAQREVCGWYERMGLWPGCLGSRPSRRHVSDIAALQQAHFFPVASEQRNLLPFVSCKSDVLSGSAELVGRSLRRLDDTQPQQSSD